MAKRINALILVGEEFLGQFLKETLAKTGHMNSIEIACDESGINEKEFDFLIIDDEFAEGGSIDKFKSLIEDKKELVSIYIAPNFSGDRLIEAKNIGATEILQRPFGEPEFLDAVYSCLSIKVSDDSLSFKHEEYCRIPIGLILKYADGFPMDLFLKLSSSKLVKISHKGSSVQEVFDKYSKKGVMDIYCEKESYLDFINRLREGLSSKFIPTQRGKSNEIDTLDQSFAVIKESFSKLGLNEGTINLAKKVSQRTQEVIEKETNLFKFYQDFKKNCREEFVLSGMIGFTAVCMIETFEWKSQAIKEKCHLAITLRDILLSKNDFLEILEMNTKGKEIDPSVKNHPDKIADFLNFTQKKWVAPEVLTIIRQHHERPDGSGFPHGLKANKIPLLSAICIVADAFVESMIKHDFDYQQKDKILSSIDDFYHQGEFRKASQALRNMF